MNNSKLYSWAITYWNELLHANTSKKIVEYNHVTKNIEHNYGYVAVVYEDDDVIDDTAVDFVYEEDHITYRVYCNENEDSYDLQYILDSDIPNMNLKLTIAENRTFEQITAIIKNLMNKNKI